MTAAISCIRNKKPLSKQLKKTNVLASFAIFTSFPAFAPPRTPQLSSGSSEAPAASTALKRSSRREPESALLGASGWWVVWGGLKSFVFRYTTYLHFIKYSSKFLGCQCLTDFMVWKVLVLFLLSCVAHLLHLGLSACVCCLSLMAESVLFAWDNCKKGSIYKAQTLP